MDEKKINLLMRNLNITREEAIQVINDDDAIDHGEKLFELTAEQKKVAKKMKNEETKNHGEVITKKSKKVVDETKDIIYNKFYNFIKEFDSNLAGSDNHRDISFMSEGKKFKITISCPRT